MSGADWLKLIIGGFFGAALTLAVQFVLQWFQHAQAKKRILWEAQLGRTRELGTVAGYLYTQLSGWAIKQHRDELYRRLGELDRFTGEFANCPYLADAISALMNTAGWILTNDGQFDTLEEREATQAELKQRYDAVNVASERFPKDNRVA